jgi:hypothetical protein
MNIPGFTAEASLSETRKGCRTNGIVSASKDLVLVLQLRPFGGGFSFEGGTVSVPPTTIGPIYFKCGWNPKTLTSECVCAGDPGCNKMFESGFCGQNANCDTGKGTCRCDLKM